MADYKGGKAIFAELIFDGHYNDIHDEIETILRRNFAQVESGLQCDSHFTIRDVGAEVKVDTFSSMHHEVKSNAMTALVNQVIRTLEARYRVTRFDPPKYEGHEPEYD